MASSNALILNFFLTTYMIFQVFFYLLILLLALRHLLYKNLIFFLSQCCLYFPSKFTAIKRDRLPIDYAVSEKLSVDVGEGGRKGIFGPLKWGDGHILRLERIIMGWNFARCVLTPST